MHKLAHTDDFAEKNATAQGLAIPHAPRLTVEPEATGQNVSVIDLPDEVKKNLVGYADMELDQLLIKTLKLFPHAVKIDRVIMTLWLNFQYQADRQRVIKRLKMMKDDGMVSKIEGTKGTYELTDHGKSL